MTERTKAATREALPELSLAVHLAHDLRLPLLEANASLHILRSEKLTRKQTVAVERLGGALDRAQAVIRFVWAIRSIERGDVAERQPTELADVVQIIKEVLDDLNRQYSD